MQIFDTSLTDNYNFNMKTFSNLDEGFVCVVCGNKVEPLKYSSRDHCPNCLCSLHVDINPGDRLNECKGIMKPISITQNSKKGYIIQYKCQKCGQVHNNKVAEDDSFKTILSVSNGKYNF